MTSSPRYERAVALAAELTAVGVPAVVDPAELVGRLNADDVTAVALVPPPTVRFDGVPYGSAGVATWRVVLVATPGVGVVRAWEYLDALLDDLDGTLSIETAEPTSYALPDAGEPVPAYVVTITETVGRDE